MLSLLNPYRWLLLAALAAALVLGVPILWHRHNAGQQRIGYEQRAAEDKVAADKQTADNRDRGRQVEIRYVTKAEVRDRFIVTTVKEIRHETDNLAACVLTPGAVQRLRDAAACARGDSETACEPDQPVPVTR